MWMGDAMTRSQHTAHALLAILAEAANSVRSPVPVTVEAPTLERNAAGTGWRVSVAFEVSDEIAKEIADA